MITPLHLSSSILSNRNIFRSLQNLAKQAAVIVGGGGVLIKDKKWKNF